MMASSIYAQDIEYTGEFGRPMIERSHHVKDSSGKVVVLSQRFLRLNRGLLYIKGSSTVETIRYGEAFCEAQGKILDIEYGIKIIEENILDQGLHKKDSLVQPNLISCNANLKFIEHIQQKAGLKYAIQQQYLGGYQLTSWYNQRGEKIIERRVQLSVPNGKDYLTQKQFLALDEKNMMYLPNSASAETLAYEEAFCDSIGAGIARDQANGILIESITPSYGLMCGNTYK